MVKKICWSLIRHTVQRIYCSKWWFLTCAKNTPHLNKASRELRAHCTMGEKEKKESEALGRLAHNCRSLTRLGVILLPLDGRLVHRKSLPKICSRVERGAVGVKCFAEEHNSVSGQGSNPDRSLRWWSAWGHRASWCHPREKRNFFTFSHNPYCSTFYLCQRWKH